MSCLCRGGSLSNGHLAAKVMQKLRWRNEKIDEQN